MHADDIYFSGVSTIPRNPGNILEFQIAPGNTGNFPEFS